MISCFVINLAHAVERRENMQRQLQALNIQAEFIQAVDGRQMSVDERQQHLNSAKMREIGWRLSPAEIGCSLSHLEIYRIMVERKIPYAVILEDDVELADDFYTLFAPEVEEQLRQDLPAEKAHVVQLNYVRRAYRAGYSVISSTRYMRVRSYSPSWSAAAYLLTLAAAKKLLQERYPVWAPADDWNYSAKQGWFTLHAMTPNPVWASRQSVDSTIGQERSPNPYPKRQGILGLCKRLFIEGIVKTLYVKPLDKQERGTIIDAKTITSNAKKKHKRLI